MHYVSNLVRMKSLERLLTRQFLPAVFLLLVIGWAAFAVVVGSGVTVDTAAKVVDATFKIAAVLAGTAWTLNRYFTSRTDELQLRVDAAADFVPADGDEVAMFVCRLDIINTGKALTPKFSELIEIESATAGKDDVGYVSLMRWPAEGLHPTQPIEPGSWSALSFAVPLVRSNKVVRVYLELHFEGRKQWTWHRHFVATGGAK